MFKFSIKEFIVDKGFDSILFFGFGGGGGMLGKLSPIVDTIGKPQSIAIGVLVGLWIFIAIKILFFDKNDRTKIKTENKKNDLKEIKKETFENETVVLDGKEFIECKFKNVTFEYYGGSFRFDGYHIEKPKIKPMTRECKISLVSYIK